MAARYVWWDGAWLLLSGGEPSGTPPTITTTVLNSMTEDAAFSQQLVATGDEPILWSVASGAVPDGLTLSPSGLLSGTPTAGGPYSFTVQATNVYGNDTQAYSGEIAEVDTGQPVTFFLQEGATTFEPWIELVAEATGTANWYDSEENLIATGLTPTITVPEDLEVTLKVEDGGTLVMSQVRIINLGFDHTQDPGPETPDEMYDYEPQPVVGVSAMTDLEGLVYFMAADTPLTGTLNFTGLPNILSVECFGANVEEVLFEGTQINRLCLEGNRITSLDLTPVADSIRDLRCAVGQVEPVEFFCDDELPNLWHYCVRDQIVTHHIETSKMPAVEQFWAWDTGVIEIEPPVSDQLNSIQMHLNPFSPETMDAWLIALDNLGVENGLFQANGSNPPTLASATARANLISKGWSLSGIPDNADPAWAYAAPTPEDWDSGDITAIGSTTPSVNAGVLTFSSNSYVRVIHQPDARSAGDCYFEIEVDREMVDGTAGTDFFAMFANTASDGTGGLRVMVRWPQITDWDSTGVTFGSSNSASGSNVIPKRVHKLPEGWEDAGPHTIGLLHVGDQASLFLDGVEVYRAVSNNFEGYNGGGYVGVGGDSDNENRVIDSWGLIEL